MKPQQQVTARIAVLVIFTGMLAVMANSVAAVLAVALIATVAMVSLISRRLFRNAVGYTRTLEPQRVFEGETLIIWRNVQNDSRLPMISLSVDDVAPKHCELIAQAQLEPKSARLEWVESITASNRDLSQTLALLPRERLSRGAKVKATRRGYYRFEPATVRVSDVLGLTEEDLHVRSDDALIVYPRMFPIEEIQLECRELFGALTALRTLVEDPLRVVGARDYAYGDSFRQIDWKSSARRGKLQTRVNERASEPALTIVLNVATFVRYWEGIETSLFECAVSLAASFASWAQTEGWAVGLSSNGNAPEIAQMPRVRARRSPKQLTRILESLAALGPHFFLSPEAFLFTEQRFLSRTTTQLILTPIMNADIIDAVQRLALQGKRLAVVCVGCEAPDIPGVLTIQAPIEPLAEYFSTRRNEVKA